MRSRFLCVLVDSGCALVNHHNRNLDLIIELFLGRNEGAFRKLGGQFIFPISLKNFSYCSLFPFNKSNCMLYTFSCYALCSIISESCDNSRLDTNALVDELRKENVVFEA